MNKLTDLRFIIGSFFSIVGLILIVTSFIINADAGSRIDLWTGLVMGIFGLLMLGTSFMGEVDES